MGNDVKDAPQEKRPLMTMEQAMELAQKMGVHEKAVDRMKKWNEGKMSMEQDNLNRVNVYTCRDGHETFTVDRDKGTTPMLIPCLHKGCKHDARSSMYCVPDAEEILIRNEPLYQWASPESFKQVPVNDVEHWRSGGLLLYHPNDRDVPVSLVWPGRFPNRAERRDYESRQRRAMKSIRKRGLRPPLPTSAPSEQPASISR